MCKCNAVRCAAREKLIRSSLVAENRSRSPSRDPTAVAKDGLVRCLLDQLSRMSEQIRGASLKVTRRCLS